MNILDIPFLELDVDIDVDKLKSELKIIEKNLEMMTTLPNSPGTSFFKKSDIKNSINKFGIFSPYKTAYWFAKRKYKQAWSGISLYSMNGSLYGDFKEGPYRNGNIQPTEIKKIAPYMFSIIDKIYGDSVKSKVRIMRIAPKSSLYWHSHVHEHGQAISDLVVQIPIHLPKGFKYCVVHKDEWKWWKRLHKPSWFKTLKESSFEEGKAFYLNSYHYHNVYNPSNEYRTTIMFYVDATHTHIQKLFKQ
tara:strand:+ start:27 stop:767 length:741 start_codon:yes stop_codon:yes gene_type:complete